MSECVLALAPDLTLVPGPVAVPASVSVSNSYFKSCAADPFPSLERRSASGT